jgi:hypothetical protein
MAAFLIIAREEGIYKKAGWITNGDFLQDKINIEQVADEYSRHHAKDSTAKNIGKKMNVQVKP